jgi:hypothetical protein
MAVPKTAALPLGDTPALKLGTCRFLRRIQHTQNIDLLANAFFNSTLANF